MSSKTKEEQEIQLDFVGRGNKLIPRKAAEIRKTPVIVDSIRIIQISTAGQVTTEVLVIEGYPYPLRRKKPLVPFLYTGTVPGKIVNLPWDLRAMWFFSHLEDPTAYKLGPVIDLKTSFPELPYITSSLGVTILHGGVVFNPDGSQRGLYRRLNPSTPEMARLLGVGI